MPDRRHGGMRSQEGQYGVQKKPARDFFLGPKKRATGVNRPYYKLLQCVPSDARSPLTC